MMAVFFNTDQLHTIAETFRNDRHQCKRIKVRYCGNCRKEQECIFLMREVPFDYWHSRICLVCGFAPGHNKGVPKKVKDQVRAADNYECVYCGSHERLECDHIIPHIHGGEATFENLLTACKFCNARRKTGRTMVLRYGRYRKA